MLDATPQSRAQALLGKFEAALETGDAAAVAEADKENPSAKAAQASAELPFAEPPAWIYLAAPFQWVSSTALRNAADVAGNNGVRPSLVGGHGVNEERWKGLARDRVSVKEPLVRGCRSGRIAIRTGRPAGESGKERASVR